MHRGLLLLCLACACAPVVADGPDAGDVPDAADTPDAADPPDAGPPEFTFTIAPLPDDVRADMTGKSWRAGCPVGLDKLSLLTLTHVDFEGNVRTGELVVATRVAEDVVSAFRAMYDAGFPIARMERVDVYGASDAASMRANNTSAFNCRKVAGSSSWSKHSYGTAIDINPVQNPWMNATTTDPVEGEPYRDRTDVRPGMIVRGGPVEAAFDAIGWGWGGDWGSYKDWQHFSEDGL